MRNLDFTVWVCTSPHGADLLTKTHKLRNNFIKSTRRAVVFTQVSTLVSGFELDVFFVMGKAMSASYPV